MPASPQPGGPSEVEAGAQALDFGAYRRRLLLYGAPLYAAITGMYAYLMAMSGVGHAVLGLVGLLVAVAGAAVGFAMPGPFNKFEVAQRGASVLASRPRAVRQPSPLLIFPLGFSLAAFVFAFEAYWALASATLGATSMYAGAAVRRLVALRDPSAELRAPRRRK